MLARNSSRSTIFALNVFSNSLVYIIVITEKKAFESDSTSGSCISATACRFELIGEPRFSTSTLPAFMFVRLQQLAQLLSGAGDAGSDG
jgi:hypothetical protein